MWGLYAKGLLMKNLLIGLVSLPLLAGIAAAGELTMLDDAQMDRMTAGQVTVKIQKPTPPSTAVNVQNMELQAPSFSLSPESHTIGFAAILC